MSQTGESMEQRSEGKISLKDLLLLLDLDAVAINTTTQSQILNQVIYTGLSMSAEARKRIDWLLTNENVKHWFTSTRSQTTLVNGHGSLERVTPMSVYCAMLAQSLNSTGSIIVLSHFCGLQSDLLRSLLIQLLAQWKHPDITCLKDDFVEKLKTTSPNRSSRQQRHLFHHLVAGLPKATPIFIIIDGTNYYETSDLLDDTKKVVREVNKLLSSESVEAMVKILITSPTRSSDLTKYFKSNEIINVPEDLDGAMTQISE
ncbi:hypothetical protein HDV62DRAFT_386038 [Trichoderma sp. SZMC 28011]